MSVTKPRMAIPSDGFVRVPAAEYRRLKERAAADYVDALTYAKRSIGRNLRRLRREAGMTQAQVARRAGIRVETLSRLENGRGNPTLATVRMVLRAVRR